MKQVKLQSIALWHYFHPFFLEFSPDSIMNHKFNNSIIAVFFF